MVAKRFFYISAGILFLALAYYLGARSATAPTPTKPWLATKRVSELEWLTMHQQATYGDTDFGENGMEVHYILGPGSADTGSVYCDVFYLPSVAAESIDLLESSIRARFEIERKTRPWASVKIVREVAQ
jgi:hypothetical protein